MNKEEFKEARHKLGLTQEQLAERLGCTAQAVYFWEAGKRQIPNAEAKLMRVWIALD